MTVVDVVICAVLAGFALKGVVHGFVREVFTLAGVVLAGWGASVFAVDVSSRIRPFLKIPENVSLILSFGLIFLVVVAASVLLAYVVTGMLRLVLLGWANRAGGLLVGFLQGCVVLVITLHFLSRCPSATVRGQIAASAAGPGFVSSWVWVEGAWSRMGSIPALLKKEGAR